MYAKLENNKLVYAPKNYDTGTNLIINFDKNIDLMKKYNFKNVIDNKPDYDNSIQYLSVDRYTETDNDVMINYTINDIAINYETILEDRIIKLEAIVTEQDEIINAAILAMNEMYLTLEPLLTNISVDTEVVNPTIEQVSEQYKKRVEENKQQSELIIHNE